MPTANNPSRFWNRTALDCARAVTSVVNPILLTSMIDLMNARQTILTALPGVEKEGEAIRNKLARAKKEEDIARYKAIAERNQQAVQKAREYLHEIETKLTRISELLGNDDCHAKRARL